MHSLQIFENIFIKPALTLDAKEDGRSWEKIWNQKLAYTDRRRRLTTAREKIRILTDRGTKFLDKRVLDIGCGDGTTLKHLAESYRCRGYGIDIAPSAITIARQVSAVQNIFYRVADGRELPFPNDTFDVVLSWGVIEHDQTYHQAVAESRRVLRSGGILILIQPHILSFAVVQEYWLRLTGKWPYGEQIDFSAAAMKTMMRQHGFHRVTTWTEPASSALGFVRTLDRVAKRLYPGWGHYLYIIATK